MFKNSHSWSNGLLFASALLLTATLPVAHAATTITEDFEGELTDGSAPGGWSVIDTGTGVYTTSAGTGNPGQSASITFASRGNSNTPSVYLVNGGDGFDVTQGITGTFDFYLIEGGNYSNLNFIFGDVQDGLSGAAGEYLNVFLDEIQFGSRADIYNGAGALLFDGSANNTYRMDTGVWISATFSWTPTSGATGDFSFSWTYPAQPNRGPMTVTGYTFDSAEAFFGFGGGDTSGYFDNISITGTAVPEPAAALLGALGSLILLRRRR